MKQLRKSRNARWFLPVKWMESPGGPWCPSLRPGRLTRPASRIILGQELPRRCGRAAHGFTLLELLVVLAIVGFIAGMVLPHVSGFNRANAVSAATRQLLDDVAYARQRAMSGRSTVYMVFLPPAFYNDVQPGGYQQQTQLPQYEMQITNLLARQCRSYALLATRSIGDQPGRHYPRYLTDWRTLPDGVYISPFQLQPNNPLSAMYVSTTNSLSGQIITNLVYQFPTNTSFPFPSVEYGEYYTLPYIGFTPDGTLTTPYTNQYIMLSRGSVLPAENAAGQYLPSPPLITETPLGNETNNPCLIQIDWLTARASVVQNQLK